MNNTQNPPENQDLGQAAEAAAATAAAPAPAPAPDTEARLAEMSDAYLRAKAEAENIRRRSLEAAIAIPAATSEQMLEGVHATLRQLVSALERNKVIEINPGAGTRFDPHQHQAISVVPAEQEANTVVTVLQKGYLIADRVLRPALVTVTAPN